MPDGIEVKACVLIIDDNVGCLQMFSTALARPGLEILTASSPLEGMALFHARRPQLVLTDLEMPEMSGMEVLAQIKQTDPATGVIVVTGHDCTEFAVEAIRMGAADYLPKPVSILLLRDRVAQLLENAGNPPDADFEGMIGSGPRLVEMFSRIRRVAHHYRSLLITGETGTGKDLVARAVHKLSKVPGRYVVLNCSAVVETLFESELFGYVKGSFTGAVHDKPGLIEHANGGTLFLDEIGDMPLATQAKLLHVLQNQEVQRIGSLTSRKVDVRIIAATNRNLRVALAERSFREDLFYRLSMVEIEVPRLADRKEDLPSLERYFTARFAALYRKEIGGLTQRVRLRLAQHSWPGNVREYENVIGHAAMMATGDTIDLLDLPPYLLNPDVRTESPVTALPVSAPDTGIVEENERILLIRALEAAEGNLSRAARTLRIGRDALRYKLRKYHLRISADGLVSAAAG